MPAYITADLDKLSLRQVLQTLNNAGYVEQENEILNLHYVEKVVRYGRTSYVYDAAYIGDDNRMRIATVYVYRRATDKLVVAGY